MQSKAVEADRYKNVETTEMFVVVDIDTTVELDASVIDASKKECTKQTRYDAQFARMEDLRNTNQNSFFFFFE